MQYGRMLPNALCITRCSCWLAVVQVYCHSRCHFADASLQLNCRGAAGDVHRLDAHACTDARTKRAQLPAPQALHEILPAALDLHIGSSLRTVRDAQSRHQGELQWQILGPGGSRGPASCPGTAFWPTVLTCSCRSACHCITWKLKPSGRPQKRAWKAKPERDTLKAT